MHLLEEGEVVEDHSGQAQFTNALTDQVKSAKSLLDVSKFIFSSIWWHASIVEMKCSGVFGCSGKRGRRPG